jgi:hypothetical protein
MGENGRHCKDIVDNAIVHRDVYCEASFRALAEGWTPETSIQFVTVTSSRSFAVRISPFAFCTSSLRRGLRVRLSRT